MHKVAQEIRSLVAALVILTIGLPAPLFSQQSPQNSGQDAGYILRAESDLVLTNVVVRDVKTGQPVLGLTQGDFTILENGKQEKIASFDFESVDLAKPLNEATISGLAASSRGTATAGSARPEDLRNHRLIVFFFDLTSMQPEDLDRSVTAAKDFLDKKLQPADLVALVSLDTSLKVDQDFTSDKQLLTRKIGMYNGTEG